MRANDPTFTTQEFTANEACIWRRSAEVIEELKPEFDAEGNLKLHEERVKEISSLLPVVNEGRPRRYLYHVEL